MKLISFEGLDGAGKTTVMNQIITIMQNSDLKTYLSYEPSNPFGKMAKFGDNNVTPGDARFLWWLARRQEQQKFENMDVDLVFKDRYYHSTWVYQGLEGTIAQDLNFDPTVFRKPDLTIFLDVAPEVSLQRMNTIKDRPIDLYETHEIEALTKRRASFHRVFREYTNSKRLVTIDTTELDIAQVVGLCSTYIWRLLEDHAEFVESQ